MVGISNVEAELPVTTFRPDPSICLHQVKFLIEPYKGTKAPKAEIDTDEMVQKMQGILD